MRRHTIKTVLAAAGLLLLAIGAAGIAPRRPAAVPLDVALVARAAFETSRPMFEARPLEPARELGRFQLTYYWMPTEAGKRRRSVPLYTRSCKRIARVSSSFARRLSLEGGGRLRDGRVLVYSGACSCESSPCYQVARRGHRWGTGYNQRPLEPFRSVAVDPRRVPIGTVLYIPELDGLTMPGHESYGGFVHDGCVVADDRGGGVRGKQIDFFAGKRIHYRSLHRRHRLRRVTVFEGGEKCRSTRLRIAARRASI